LVILVTRAVFQVAKAIASLRWYSSSVSGLCLGKILGSVDDDTLSIVK
jgi:hypothetical protein